MGKVIVGVVCLGLGFAGGFATGAAATAKTFLEMSVESFAATKEEINKARSGYYQK